MFQHKIDHGAGGEERPGAARKDLVPLGAGRGTWTSVLPEAELESREGPTISRQPFLFFCGSRSPCSERDSLTWLVHRYRVRIPTIAGSIVRQAAVPQKESIRHGLLGA